MPISVPSPTPKFPGTESDSRLYLPGPRSRVLRVG